MPSGERPLKTDKTMNIETGSKNTKNPGQAIFKTYLSLNDSIVW